MNNIKINRMIFISFASYWTEVLKQNVMTVRKIKSMERLLESDETKTLRWLGNPNFLQ